MPLYGVFIVSTCRGDDWRTWPTIRQMRHYGDATLQGYTPNRREAADWCKWFNRLTDKGGCCVVYAYHAPLEPLKPFRPRPWLA